MNEQLLLAVKEHPYPLLFAIGVALTPWDKLIAAFTLPVATV